jgi:hypothetical protein
MTGAQGGARSTGTGVAIHVLVSVVLGGGLLAACSADEDGDGAPVTSPLAQILGWGMAEEGGAGAGQISEVERQRHDRVERLTADCMAGRGFEYVPVPLEDLNSGPFDEAYALPPEAFAIEYGYGVTTLTPPATDLTPDPNQEIQARLSEQEREAYRRALWGGAVSGGDGSDPGCQRQSSQQVYGTNGREAELQQRFEELFDALNSLWERIESDPRLDDTDHDWVACMTQAGYPGFNRPHDARQSVFEAMAALRAAGEPDPKELAALRDYELALAPVDQRCREVHIIAPRREVAYELEAEFVADHRAELEAYRDWVSGAGG